MLLYLVACWICVGLFGCCVVSLFCYVEVLLFVCLFVRVCIWLFDMLVWSLVRLYVYMYDCVYVCLSVLLD